MLTQRQEELFTDIVEHYIKTSEPIGSKVLAQSKKWNVSSATVRNEMSVLEKNGLIMQPYTSAGRIPTEKGYQYYRSRYIHADPLTATLQKILADSYREHSREGLKSLARTLSNISKLAVLVGVGREELYYTGIRHLLDQFDNDAEVHQVVATLEEHEQEIAALLESLSDETTVMIGSENPLLSGCAIVAAPMLFNNQRSYIGILGPMRMQYRKIVSLVNGCTIIIQ